ncbi:MAG: peptide chain release factor 2 [Alphaproteobacteria bacterium]|nr:peptide chain release factor 2 [Rickettsiales bacterium]
MIEKEEISLLLDKLTKIGLRLNISENQKLLIEVNNKLEDKSIWEDAKELANLSKKRSDLLGKVCFFEDISKKSTDLMILFLLAQEEEDSRVMDEVVEMYDALFKEVENLFVRSLFFSSDDKKSCFIDIKAGAGGTDSQDLAQMVVRMYTMWAQKKGYKVKNIDTQFGEEYGIKSATLEIDGYLAFGHLSNENGVHRFVRISPFNTNGKRQTSFISVFAYPVADFESDSVELLDKDLRIDTYRSSGAGGQHVNTTDSAVRIVHLPTGIVSQSQSQRSQMQNKTEAMRMLRAKIIKVQEDKKNKAKKDADNIKADISWGNQIRNYVFQPYRMVKDLRSGYETARVDDVINGDLDDIINSVIRLKNGHDL